jgi:AcrR family transcriptional regulator
MVRKTKLPEERRKEIIKTAKQLFEEKGYGATQISDITNKMGVAHGLVYHYVKSKSDLLDAVVNEWAKEIVAELLVVMKDTSLPALVRLENMFTFTLNLLEKDASMINIVQRSEHNEIQKRISNAGINIVLPVFRDLIEQGIVEGSFHCSYPEETAKFCLFGWVSIDLGEKKSDESRIDRLKYFFCKMLGID